MRNRIGMSPTRYLLTALTLFLALGALPAQAAVVLFTDFTDRSVSGSTASNIVWTTDGVADPGDLTAVDSNPKGLFDTADAQGKFAPSRNLGYEGPWSVNIALDVLATPIALGEITLDAFIFNNSGELQSQNRSLHMTLALLDSSENEVATQTILNIYPNNTSPPSQPQSVVFDFAGNTLAADSNFILRLTAFGNNSVGNNAGIGSFEVEGSFVTNDPVAIPTPATAMLLGAGLLGLVGIVYPMRRGRRQRGLPTAVS